MAQLHDDIIKMLTNNGINWEEKKQLAIDIKDLVIKYGATDNIIQTLKADLFTPFKMKKGTTCKVCNQHVKMYRHGINAEAGKCLISLFWLDALNPTKIWFHVHNDIDIHMNVSGNWAKMRHFKLIEEMPKDEKNKKKKTTGYWRITDTGKAFVQGTIKLPQYAKLYNQSFFGYDTEMGKPVGIREVLGKEFNYHELMNR